jgi:hypothetical protein
MPRKKIPPMTSKQAKQAYKTKDSLFEFSTQELKCIKRDEIVEARARRLRERDARKKELAASRKAREQREREKLRSGPISRSTQLAGFSNSQMKSKRAMEAWIGVAKTDTEKRFNNQQTNPQDSVGLSIPITPPNVELGLEAKIDSSCFEVNPPINTAQAGLIAAEAILSSPLHPFSQTIMRSSIIRGETPQPIRPSQTRTVVRPLTEVNTASDYDQSIERKESLEEVVETFASQFTLSPLSSLSSLLDISPQPPSQLMAVRRASPHNATLSPLPQNLAIGSIHQPSSLPSNNTIPAGMTAQLRASISTIFPSPHTPHPDRALSSQNHNREIDTRSSSKKLAQSSQSYGSFIEWEQVEAAFLTTDQDPKNREDLSPCSASSLASDRSSAQFGSPLRWEEIEAVQFAVGSTSDPALQHMHSVAEVHHSDPAALSPYPRPESPDPYGSSLELDEIDAILGIADGHGTQSGSWSQTSVSSINRALPPAAASGADGNPKAYAEFPLELLEALAKESFQLDKEL